MAKKEKPIANPSIVFREDFDEWAILFDPDSGNTLGINPVGVFVWQRLDGKHTIQDIMTELSDNYEDIPAEAEDHITDFIKDLVERGLAGYESEEA